MPGMTDTTPTALRAGDSASWQRSDLATAYPLTSGWAIKCRILWPTGASAVTLVASAAGVFAVSSAESVGWVAGAATLVVFAERGTERATIEQRQITILPDLTQAANLDGRSPAQRRLANARAALEQYLANGQMHVAEYDIGGRRMRFRDAREIHDLIAQCERDVARERALLAAGKGYSAGRVCTRM